LGALEWQINEEIICWAEMLLLLRLPSCCFVDVLFYQVEWPGSKMHIGKCDKVGPLEVDPSREYWKNKNYKVNKQ